MVFFACFLLVLQALLLTLILADSVEVMEIKRDPVPESLIADMEDDYYMIGPEFFATSVCPDPDDISGMDIAPDTRDMDMVRDSYNMTAHEASIGASALGMAAVSFVGKPEHKGAYIVPKGWHQSVRYWNQICWWGRAGKRDKCWAHKSCRFEVFIRNYSQESQVSPRDSTCGLGLLDNLRGGKLSILFPLTVLDVHCCYRSISLVLFFFFFLRTPSTSLSSARSHFLHSFSPLPP